MPPSLPDSGVLFLLSLAAIVVAAVAVLIWAFRSPGAMNNPWVAPAVFVAIIVIAAAMAPFYAVLLFLVLPAAVIALVIYLFLRTRVAT